MSSRVLARTTLFLRTFFQINVKCSEAKTCVLPTRQQVNTAARFPLSGTFADLPSFRGKRHGDTLRSPANLHALSPPWVAVRDARSTAGVRVRRKVHPSELRTWTTLRHLESPRRTLLPPFSSVPFSISGAGKDQCSGLKEITMSIKITTGLGRLAIHPWQSWRTGQPRPQWDSLLSPQDVLTQTNEVP